jgi:hypothetical protein
MGVERELMDNEERDISLGLLVKFHELIAQAVK